MNKFKLWLLGKLGGEPKRAITPPSPVYNVTGTAQFMQFRGYKIVPKGASRQEVSRNLARKIGEQMYDNGYIVIKVHDPIWHNSDECTKYTAKAYAVKPGDTYEQIDHE